MKIECDELLVIRDNCGHAIHVKELDNNSIELNNKNDKLISIQDAIDALIEWYGCEPNGMDYFKEILAKKSSAQPERLTDDDFETIRIHLSAYKEQLCNQHRWKEAEEYQKIIDRFMSFASAQPEQQWTPVSKKLPEKEGRYWVWTEKSFTPDHVDEPNRYQGSTEADFMGGRWYGRDVEEVIAWMPLPKPKPYNEISVNQMGGMERDMNNDLISRQAATTIPILPKEHRRYQTMNIDDAYDLGWLDYQNCIEKLPPEQLEHIQNNSVHLCDSCQYTFPACPSRDSDVIFGDGKGNDNICACNKYLPTQPKIITCIDCKYWDGKVQGGFYYFEHCSLHNIDAIQDDFCSYAERREE